MTTPVFELHPGDDLDGDVKMILTQYAASIDELVSFGTHVLDWDLAEATGRMKICRSH
jgi:hypothetical protein